MVNTIIKELPLGITLVLEVGESEQFLSRYMATAPETKTKVLEQLLDGQQRLTALWRILQNNYEDETYFVYLPEYDESTKNKGNEDIIHSKARYNTKRVATPFGAMTQKNA